MNRNKNKKKTSENALMISSKISQFLFEMKMIIIMENNKIIDWWKIKNNNKISKYQKKYYFQIHYFK